MWSLKREPCAKLADVLILSFVIGAIASRVNKETSGLCDSSKSIGLVMQEVSWDGTWGCICI